MSTTVDTYLRVKNQFVPMTEYSATLPNKDYVEGAIDCRINNRELFTIEHWDLVDQLWVYILEGLSKVKRGEEYDSFFPDQPLRLRFKPISAYAVEVTIGTNCQKFDIDSLVTALAEGATEFFTSMKKLLPESSDTWDRYLTVANSLICREGKRCQEP
jgi:hypothetical protein